MSVRAVVFDASVLMDTPEPLQEELGDLLIRIRDLNIRVVVFSTDPVDANARMSEWGLPPVDLLLTRSDVGKNKGSPLWFERACKELSLSRHELIYIGDSNFDWIMAINSAVMYINAEWTGQTMAKEALRADTPADIWPTLSHFFLQAPRWQYSLDIAGRGSHHIRALLNAATKLPSKVSASGEVEEEFRLQTVLTYELDVHVSGLPAKSLLMMHALTSLYLEGLIPPGVLICSYPSHTPEKTEGILDDWLLPAAKAFHGWYKADLLVRATDAPDTSRLRAAGRRATPEMQMSTVHVNPSYKGRLTGRTVILLDDFTTEGTSLEWGRHLLQAAGAASAILVTIGKYGRLRPITHCSFELLPGAAIDPYVVTDARFNEVFKARHIVLYENLDAKQILVQSFAHIGRDEAYPLEAPDGRLIT